VTIPKFTGGVYTYRGNWLSGETSQYDVRRWSAVSPSLSEGFDAEFGGAELLDIVVKGSRRDVSRERVGAISSGEAGGEDELGSWGKGRVVGEVLRGYRWWQESDMVKGRSWFWCGISAEGQGQRFSVCLCL
jgi:hypothetical protein